MFRFLCITYTIALSYLVDSSSLCHHVLVFYRCHLVEQRFFPIVHTHIDRASCGRPQDVRYEITLETRPDTVHRWWVDEWDHAVGTELKAK